MDSSQSVNNTTFFQSPPLLKNQQGTTRRVGFEIEFGGITLEQAVEAVIKNFGGTSYRTNNYSHGVKNSLHGNFTIELDSLFFKDKYYEKYLEKLGINLAEFVEITSFEDFLSNAAAFLIPHEVVTPPIPIDCLNDVEKLKTTLYEQSAKGTGASIRYAFGLHMNPETPSLDVTVILGHLRAFLLLYEWINEQSEIDFTRQLLPYIKPFPGQYVQLILTNSYRPDIDQFIADYLYFNPTRNRPLDLTPLLAVIDEEKVLQNITEKNLLKKRPAFHYRLPNCLIDEPLWTIAGEWNLWVTVERLAANPDKMKLMCADYMETKSYLLDYLLDEWPLKVDLWLSK
ncbi:MAG: amidoligase family protein [Desulfobulbaceae bacterium]|nr:amidoligase family protein [Desulfobulbaceae bacterium]